MKQKIIKKIIEKKAHKLADFAADVGRNFDENTIHEFRITLKSLRAFLHLLKTNNPGLSLKLPKELKYIYHIAGSIREAQLELIQLKTRGTVLSSYRAALQQIIVDHEKEWNKNYSTKICRKLNNKLQKQKYKPVETSDIINFIESRLQSIRDISNAHTLSEVSIHTSRKHGKEILYIIKLVQEKWDTNLPKLNTRSITGLDKITTKLGQYHDERLQYDHLLSFVRRSLKSEEMTIIKKTLKKSNISLAKDRTKIIEILRTLSAANEDHIFIADKP